MGQRQNKTSQPINIFITMFVYKGVYKGLILISLVRRIIAFVEELRGRENEIYSSLRVTDKQTQNKNQAKS